MRYYHQKLALNVLVFSAVLSAFLMFCAPALRAQQQRSPAEAAMERQRQRQIRQNQRIESNLMITTLEKESRLPAETSRPSLAYVQIKQDFLQLQTVNNRMMETTFANNVVDYKGIAEASAEIRKRAARLKSNLPLPESENDENVPELSLKGWDELDVGQVKPALKALDDLIMSFVGNPIFQKPQVVDVQQSAKARRELEAIIKLSAKIKKSAEKLTKATAKT
ncbi:MAG TPA: hypothetical protein VF735_20255 [Pyrinomonadaceae bacterium]|jgi:hypothetical protein